MRKLQNYSPNDTSVLVTGNAGFIGFHISEALLKQGFRVVGIDNINDYYDPTLKEARLEILRKYDNFSFRKIDLADQSAVSKAFREEKFDLVVHLAAQAGVRYSLINPRAYLDANFIGFFNVLEESRLNDVRYLVYASSSSVYGLNTKMPFSVEDKVDRPISLYAASKKSNELTAHSYSHLFGLPTTGLRFFTVYGPWGRPDMALFKFSRSILLGEPLTLFNFGNMNRDFTYIDDIVDGVLGVIDNPPVVETKEDDFTGKGSGPYRVYNIGAGKPVELKRFLKLIEENLGKKAIVELAPMQDGDVPSTFADIEDLRKNVGYEPRFTVEEGIRRFVDWFKDYYGSGRPIPKM